MLHGCFFRRSSRVGLSVAALAIVVVARTAPGNAADECPPGQFLAQYYDTSNNGNRRVFTSCERSIEHDWGARPPNKGSGGDGDSKSDSLRSLSVGPNNFRVTWTGRFIFQDDVYTFIAVADDGIRVKVDGQTIVDEWRVQPATEFRRGRQMTAGTHTVDVEYFQANEAAVAKVRWQRGS